MSKSNGKPRHPKTKLTPVVEAICSRCKMVAKIQESHIGRKHKVCLAADVFVPANQGSDGQTKLIPRERVVVRKKVPGFAYNYDGSLIYGVDANTRVPLRVMRTELAGDRTENGKWVRA